ncbi:MAG: hypothetical protein K0B10_01020 [Vicingaceae bacterium]|nr:hypothetical protein [Vicingaceae bacterium]
MNISLTFLVIAFAEKVSKADSEPHELYVASIIYSIVYLSGAIILNYNLHYDFNHFLLYSYSFILVRIVWITFWTFILRKNL